MVNGPSERPAKTMSQIVAESMLAIGRLKKSLIRLSMALKA
ncbi:MAG: hypothetical protein QOE73_1270 [Verrucomicrobiota bacterium]